MEYLPDVYYQQLLAWYSDPEEIQKWWYRAWMKK
jgi:hypothetical protein